MMWSQALTSPPYALAGTLAPAQARWATWLLAERHAAFEQTTQHPRRYETQREDTQAWSLASVHTKGNVIAM